MWYMYVACTADQRSELASPLPNRCSLRLAGRTIRREKALRSLREDGDADTCEDGVEAGDDLVLLLLDAADVRYLLVDGLLVGEVVLSSKQCVQVRVLNVPSKQGQTRMLLGSKAEHGPA